MKRIILIAGIFILFSVLSCDKNVEITGPDKFPEWLKLKIAELIQDQHLCEITDVTIIEYNGKRYYHIYAGLWSCVYCQLFDEQGNRPVWEGKDWDDFFIRKKDIQKVQACS
jgi:hypothetical protein